jgi:hypothetical protein
MRCGVPWLAGSVCLAASLPRYLPAQVFGGESKPVAKPQRSLHRIADALMLDYEVNCGALTIASIAHIVYAKVHDALRRDGKILFQIAAERPG